MSTYSDIDSCHFCGSIGALIDDLPMLTHANVRPYVVAVLLHRGAVCFSEVISSISPHCALDDLRISDESEYGKSRLEELVEEVLGEMVQEKILRYNEQRDLWVLTPGSFHQNVPKVISWASTLGAQIPHHFTLEMSDAFNDYGIK